jgi:hypothetical protein
VPAHVSDAFIAARLERDAFIAYGALPPDVAFPEIIERASPVG